MIYIVAFIAFWLLVLSPFIFLGLHWIITNWPGSGRGTTEEKIQRLKASSRLTESPALSAHKITRLQASAGLVSSKIALSQKLGDFERFTLEERLKELEAEWNVLVKDEERRNQQTAFQKATEAGMPADVYNRVKEQEGIAQVELLKHQGLKDIDWEFLEKEHDLKLKGALLLAIKEHREMEGLTEMYETLVRRRHQIETGNDAEQVKQKLLERYDRNIQILDGVINGKGNRLLQEVDGENV